jgi:hypothetical protein
MPILRRFRVIPQLDTYPGVVTLVQSTRGRILLLSCAAIGLRLAEKQWLPVTICLVFMTFLPAGRRQVLTFCTLFWATWLSGQEASSHFVTLTHVGRSSELAMFIIAASLRGAVLGVGAGLFYGATKYPNSLLGKRPLLLLLGGFFTLILAASYIAVPLAVHNAVWLFLNVFATYLWFIGYSLLDRNSINRDRFSLQLGTFQPFWASLDTPFTKGSTVTPFVKGAAYLRRIEAKSSEELAITQLKGLKLLGWALVLKLVSHELKHFLHGYLGIATYDQILGMSLHRVPFHWYVGWASLLAFFFEDVLDMAVYGHIIVAGCRLAGFRALRNTYRPLESRTIAEFWNRYYFYYKELLVEFFFYPAFMRYFKGRRKARLFFATFAAASIGNMYYHFCRDLYFVTDLGFWKAFAGFQTFAFYTVLLAVGIGISQWIEPQPRPGGWVRTQLWPSVRVIAFFSLLHVFDDVSRTIPLSEHFRVLVQLFNFEGSRVP